MKQEDEMPAYPRLIMLSCNLETDFAILLLHSNYRLLY